MNNLGECMPTLHDAEFVHPPNPTKYVEELVPNFFARCLIIEVEDVALKWHPPVEGMMKINVDAAVGNNQCNDFGGGVRDHSGLRVYGFYGYLGKACILTAGILGHFLWVWKLLGVKGGGMSWWNRSGGTHQSP